MTLEELKKLGGLYVERVTDGFAQYDSRITHMGEREAAAYMRRLREENGADGAFVDFYYHFLDDDAKQRVLSVLDGEQQAYVRGMDSDSRDLIYPLSDELIDIAARLNDREMLFCTVYFTRTPCTLWGNYKQEYVIFTPRSWEK